jgi:hypothetical protein
MATNDNIIYDDEMYAALNEYGKDVIKYLGEQLIKMDKVASGKLLRSLDYKLRKVVDQVVIEIISEDYLSGLNSVDEGTKPGNFPVTKTNIMAIKQWCMDKDVPPVFAGAITQKIFQRGIPATNIIDKTIKHIESDYKLGDILELGLSEAVEAKIDDFLSRITSKGNISITYK